jgi:hypothetical protein
LEITDRDEDRDEDQIEANEKTPERSLILPLLLFADD